jgi:S-adenosylmethionine:tRNA ribosyltransferase-isomerase
MDHHANMSFAHKCVNGVDVDLEFYTFEANELTDKDYEAARKVDAILNNEKVKMSDFTYDLQLDSIAKYPAEPRGSSRLLRVDAEGNVHHFENFSKSILSFVDGAHIIFNESKVVNARLSVIGSEKDKFEMMILDLGDDIDKSCRDAKLSVMVRKDGVLAGDIFTEEGKGTAKFRVVKVVGPWIEDENSNGNGTECVVECLTEDETTVAGLLESVGTVPIPPYLNRDAEASDVSAYNNVFASGEGSVAAPTAGLHFTDALLAEIGSENISFLRLHVGAGTFKPVVTEDALDHSMHGENFAVNVGEIHRIIESVESGKRIIVVGTTSSRTLESMYWCGVKILQNKKNGMASNTAGDRMTLGQHEWTYLATPGEKVYTAAEALKAVIDGKDSDDTVFGRTSLMIRPGYEFRVVEELVTNFHAPDSTLMLLVSTFLGGGDKVREVYEEAQELGYKFLSYGDACFFSRRRK